MATNGAIKSRIQLKNDTEANWNKAGPKDGSLGFIPLKGELIIYLADEAHPFSRLKVGDGATNVVNLPFVGSEILDTLEEHIADEVRHITAMERESWNNRMAIAYSVCTTSAAIAQKEVIINNFELKNGTTIHITFTDTNSAKNPTLKVNNLEPIPIYPSGAAWESNSTVDLAYDGVYWRVIGSGVAKKLAHKLTFGARQAYVFDGSQDVTVPVYNGTTI